MAIIGNHMAGLLLLALSLAALPAYVSTMELSLIDLEFLAALCGFSGWGSGG